MSGLSEIIIIAGPNGAGKTTFARHLLPVAPDFVFVNADEIAKERAHRNLPQDQRNLSAGREMLGRIASNIELRRNIMFETTLASRSFARSIPHWQSFGYEITLYYLLLPTAEMAMERVKQRVATGGHDIPEIVIRRRFARSLANLEKTYKHLVDSWYIYSGETQKLIASGRR